MLHAQLGRHPLQINIKPRMIGFWLSIVNGIKSKLSKLLYSIMLKDLEKGFFNFKWIHCINGIHLYLFLLADMIFLKLNQSITQILWKWIFHEHCQICIFKNGMRKITFPQRKIIYFEKYLIDVSKVCYSKIIKHKTGNHRLSVETGRWDVPLNER